MKFRRIIYCLCVLFVIMLIGCNKDNQDILNHNAMKLEEEGYYEIRYESALGDGDSEPLICTVSVDVLKDMNEDQMLDIARYMELCYMTILDSNMKPIGRRENDFECYMVFYKGNTDEEIEKIKYINGERVEIIEEDNHKFAPAYFK